MSWQSRVFLIVAAVWSAASLAGMGLALSFFSRRSGDTVHHAMWLLALSSLLSFPLWLPAIIPKRFPLFSRVVRWISALIMLIPTYLSGTVVTHNVGRWLKGWEAWPSLVVDNLLNSACCIAVIAVLLLPEARVWLRASASVIDQDREAKRKPIWKKALTALAALFLVIMVVDSITAGLFIYDTSVSSELWIRNYSGSDVRFEKVTVDGQPVWSKPDIVIKTLKNFEKPWLDNRGDTISPRFRAPKRDVELQLVTANEKGERETVSCTLDNRKRPCLFEVFYYKGKLVAHEQRDGDSSPKRGPDGEGDVGKNWPNPEWPQGPYKQPIK